MEICHTEHSHIIGKAGNNIKNVMSATGCHIHFPDSNRSTSSMSDKISQVCGYLWRSWKHNSLWMFTWSTGFYRAMLCICGTSHGPVSVCLSVCLSVSVSVTSRCSTKTAKRRITQTTPHDSPGTLVFWCQRSPRNSTGVTPYESAECRWGGSKSATLDQ